MSLTVLKDVNDRRQESHALGPADPQANLRLGILLPAGIQSGSYSAELGRNLLLAAVILILVLAVFEGPVRYYLNTLGVDWIIFSRDAFAFVAMVAYAVTNSHRKQTVTAVGVFFFLFIIHTAVSLLNTKSIVPGLYGLKVFLPGLCAYLICQCIFAPSVATTRIVAVLWLVSVTGAAVDKFILDFPWVGLNVELGGIDVALGRDWQSTILERGRRLDKIFDKSGDCSAFPCLHYACPGDAPQCAPSA